MKVKKPKYEKPVKIRWLNGVPFGGDNHEQRFQGFQCNKEEYMEQMMEYNKTIKRRKKNDN